MGSDEMRRVEEKIITDDEFNYLRSQIVTSSWNKMRRGRIPNPDLNCGEFAIIKSPAGLCRFTLTPKQWIEKSQQTVGQISSQALLLLEKPIAKQAAVQFETKVRQQAVGQLTPITWGHN